MPKKSFSFTPTAWRVRFALPSMLCAGLIACGDGNSDALSPPPVTGPSAAARLKAAATAVVPPWPV